MNCQRVEELRMAFLCGELDSVEARQVEQHLDSCSSCQRWISEVRQTMNTLDAFSVPDADPTDPQRIRELAKPARQMSRVRWAAAILVFLSIGIGVLALLRSEFEVKDGSVTVRLSFRESEPAAESHADSQFELIAHRLQEIEQQYQQDLFALAISVDLAREESERLHDARMREVEFMTARELMAQREAIDGLVNSAAPARAQPN